MTTVPPSSSPSASIPSTPSVPASPTPSTVQDTTRPNTGQVPTLDTSPSAMPLEPHHPLGEPSDMIMADAMAFKDDEPKESGLKIRIRRDLPNLPDVFRKRGIFRSQSGSASSSPGDSPPSSAINVLPSSGLFQTKLVMALRPEPESAKRTHNDMLSEDVPSGPRNYHLSFASDPDTDKRIKPEKKELPIPTSSAPLFPAAGKNIAFQTNALPLPKPMSPSPIPPLSGTPQPPSETEDVVMASPPTLEIKQEEVTESIKEVIARQSEILRHSISRSNSGSPTPTLVRFPTPTSLGGGTGGESEGTPPPTISHLSLADAVALPEGNLLSDAPLVVSTVDIPFRSLTKSKKKKISSPSVITQMPELVDDPADIDVVGSPVEEAENIEPLELVRIGQSILDRLLNNPVCQYFINMVPLTASNYHAVIKKPMDLTTMERRLWRTIKIAFTPGFSYTVPDATETADNSKGYVTLRELESDFNRIYQNAVYFNPSAHMIHKQAQAFRGLYKGLSLAFKDERLLPTDPLPQEVYRSDIVSLSKPGSLYLFRACTPREMDHKMTDLSNELYAALHQPLFEAGDELEKVTPESPRFARLYINKNRSILSKIRDELDAKVLVLSDIRVTRPAGKKAAEDRKPTDAHMITLQARAIVVKPLGEKHDMITVGDLDCPIAWIMVAVVKSVNITVEVPRRFERGVLSKMKHEIIPFNKTDKAGLECHSVITEALGMLTSSAAASPSTPVSESTAEVPPHIEVVSNSDRLSTSLNDAVQILQARKRSLSDTDFAPQSAATSSKQPRPISPPPVLAIVPLPPLVQDQLQSSTPNLSGYDSPASVSSASTSTGSTSAPMEIDTVPKPASDPPGSPPGTQLTPREQQMLQSLKVAAQQMNVPYVSWNSIKPKLTMDTAQGLFKRIYHFRDDDSVVAQNFKEMDSESFEQRVREVACLVKLRGIAGVGQIQSVLDDEDGHLVGLSMTKYAYTLKAYATNARKPLTACQKLSLVLDIVEAVALIHGAGLAHRDLSEVNIMVSEDPVNRLADDSPRPWVRVIDFGKSVFVLPEDVKRWSIQEQVSDEELALLPLVVLPPDHGYKLYRSILTLPRSKGDHSLLPPVDPRLEDVYSLGILIWRIFSGKSPWNGTIEDDIKVIRHMVSSDTQIQFYLQREVTGKVSRELLLKCLTAESETRSTAEQVKEFLAQEGVVAELLKEFEELGSGRKKTRKNLD
ncbi:hypothetical protein BGZ59_004553 [Podila verticillata]|nr:hypothetical protein BGZ59_004553 [Podila verticillata]